MRFSWALGFSFIFAASAAQAQGLTKLQLTLD